MLRLDDLDDVGVNTKAAFKLIFLVNSIVFDVDGLIKQS